MKMPMMINPWRRVCRTSRKRVQRGEIGGKVEGGKGAGDFGMS